MLARFRELLHLRVANADDKWEANDLNDILYLCGAAGYADVVVGERKTCNYLLRMTDQVPSGAEVFWKPEQAVTAIETKIA